MLTTRLTSALSIATALLAAAHAHANLDVITLFGKDYLVSRFDYSASIRFPNRAFPSDPNIPLIEVEGAAWLGNNRLALSADDIGDVAPGNPENWVVEVELLYAPGSLSPTGIALSRVLVVSDVPVAGFDLNPGGVTVNTGSAGLGAGGNLVVCGGDGLLVGYSLQSANLGAQLPFPAGSPCTPPVSCAIDLSPGNTNSEDATYVPVRGGEFFVINQDTSSLERWSATTGARLGSFPIGGAVPGGLPGAVPKGVTYLADGPMLPPAIRRPGGVVIAAFDRNFPALQAFDTDGNFIANQVLTTNGTPGGPSLLSLQGCPLGLNIESLAGDPATGRLFLVNQGAFELCSYLWALTPIGQVCTPDFNGDGTLDPDDLADYIACYFNTPPCPQADFNGDSNPDPDDLSDFIAAYFAGCP